MLFGKQFKLGILGGGQLGAMLMRSAIDFGLEVAVLDKDAHAPAARYTSSFTCGDPLNYDDVLEFGKQCDVITIEKEAVNVDALRALSALGVAVRPSPDLIEFIQDKYLQKQFLESAGVPTPAARAFNGIAEIETADIQYPVCQKLRRNGYDGTGVTMLYSKDDLGTKAFEEPSIIEELIDIGKEISIIVARNPSGDMVCYDPVSMIFDKEKHVLSFQMGPANLSTRVATEAFGIALKIAEAAQLVGIMAIEMFVTKDDRVLVNELAPRPHNSGHHTMEASSTSQFEQHLRAILDLPLGATKSTAKSAMVNILDTGSVPNWKRLAAMQNVHLHLYGKYGGRIGRKLGHITIAGDTFEDVAAKTAAVRNLLNG